MRADGKKLRDALQSKVKKELSNLRNHLGNIAESVYKQINTDIYQVKEDVKRGAQNLDQYVVFVRGLRAAGESLKHCEE